MSPKRCKKSRPNKGSFKPGYDPRRHRFTRDECRLGLYVAYANATPDVKRWLLRRCLIHYREKNRGKKAG